MAEPARPEDLVTAAEAMRQLREALEVKLTAETPEQRAHREEGRARLAALHARRR